jgi:hypothetical protein
VGRRPHKFSLPIEPMARPPRNTLYSKNIGFDFQTASLGQQPRSQIKADIPEYQIFKCKHYVVPARSH